jgi:hypothetical protein
MSFDIFLYKFSRGMRAEANWEAVLIVLKTANFTGSGGSYIVKFPDGIDVEFSARKLEGKDEFTNCVFFVRGMSPLLIKFIFEIAKAGDMAILPAMENFVPILTSTKQKQHLPESLAENEPPAIVCESALELESLLCGGYNSWKKYRDQIVGSGGKS